ncbi:MAG TPA: DUF420 domain-containing protein [Pirellulaceae bacterium]
MPAAIEILPHINAALNALATVLLIVGYVQIKRRQEIAHKWTMLACFGVSVVFLACYLTYHFNIPGGSKRFPSYPPDAIRYGYYALLLSHVLLAAAVPFLAVITIWLGLADRRLAHRKLAWWTFPIWLYVSITGVIVYLLLYQIYPPRS